MLAIGILAGGSLLFVGGFYLAERTFIPASLLFTLWLAGAAIGAWFFWWLWRREENHLGGLISGILLFIYGGISSQGALGYYVIESQRVIASDASSPRTE